MKGVPRDITQPSPGNYYKPETRADEHGLLGDNDNPSGTVMESALQNRRQKLAGKKIGLAPTPGDQGEQ